MERGAKVAAFTEVNERVLETAVAASAGAEEWDFFCECGKPDCHERVALTIEAFYALRGARRPVLAPGHRLSPHSRARMLSEETAALRAQAEHHVKRAKKNLGR